MGHAPNLPSKEFAGKSRIGDYGDKMMEGDHHVGQVLDALKELELEDNTIVVFASDNGPYGSYFDRDFGPGIARHGQPGPVPWQPGRGDGRFDPDLRFVRWPGHVKPDSTSYAMFSVMDFLPTFADILGCKLPTDRAIDGVDQTDVLSGKSERGTRVAAHLHRPGPGRSALEAMAPLP